MAEQLMTEIENWLAVSREATQPIPGYWGTGKVRFPDWKGKPSPEIENEEGEMERKLFIDREALREWEVRMCFEAVIATFPKDEPKWDSTEFMIRVFRTLTRFQVRKLLGKYELTEKAQKPWEKGVKPNANNENNISEVDNELV